MYGVIAKLVSSVQYLLFSQIILGSLGLFILPLFLESYGIFSVYVFVSILLVCVLPLTKGIDAIWRMKEENIFKEQAQGAVKIVR